MLSKSKLSEVCAVPTRCVDCPIRARSLFQVLAERYLSDAQRRRSGQYRLGSRQHLYSEGATATAAYTVFAGWLLLFRTHSDGTRQGLRIALPGDFVGYASHSEDFYSHGAMAVGDVVVCGFRQADLHAMIDHHPDIGRQITAIQARYLANCEINVLSLGRKSAEQRIAHLVSDLYHRLELRAEVDAENGVMPFPLTQEMLGELTGLTPVHTNRVLRKLRTDGFMRCERRHIEIMDLPGLMRLGEYLVSQPR